MNRSIYLDTNVLITMFEGEGPSHTALWEFVHQGIQVLDVSFRTSVLSFSELLVRPYRNRNRALARQYLMLASSGQWLHSCRVEPAVIDAAAILRARLGLKLPDSIHLSTAAVNSCGHLLTFDAGMASIPALEHPLSGNVVGAPVDVIRPHPASLSELAQALS